MNSWRVFAMTAGCLVAAAPAAWAGPTIVFLNLTNPGPQVATDLSLTFSTKINPNLAFAQSNPLTDATIDAAGTTVTFNQGTQGGVQKGKNDLAMVWLAPGPTKLTAAAWSYPIGANVAIPAPKITIIIGKKLDLGEVSITNDDTQTVYFENVEDATALDPSIFYNLGNDITDELYASNPESNFSLAPGQTEDFVLGNDPGDDYSSVLFTASTDPTFATNDFIMAEAGDVPEPSSLEVVVAGLIGLAFWRARRPARHRPLRAAWR